MSARPKPKILVVTGPTASGKTPYALELAQELRGEIVSADSMQVYRLLDIGTAKPSLEERSRVPHHLIDVADPDETYHVGRYRREASDAIAGILARGRTPVVVGGTALYWKVLLFGLAEGPGRDEGPRRDLEARWEEQGGPALWEALRRADPELAARLHPNDRIRILRGLEVWETTGQPLSGLQSRHRFSESDYDALLLGLEVERQELYRRIDDRVRDMLRQGWIDEVKKLLALGYSASLPPLQAIGYRQICRLVAGGGDEEQAAEEIQRETRRFAKRQMTWFRRMPIRWVKGDDTADGLGAARKFLQTGPRPI